MTLAVAALFAQGQTRIRNVYNWRVKVRLAAFWHTCPSLTTAYHHALTNLIACYCYPVAATQALDSMPCTHEGVRSEWVVSTQAS